MERTASIANSDDLKHGAQLGDDNQAVALAQIEFLNRLAKVVFNFHQWWKLNCLLFSTAFNSSFNAIVTRLNKFRDLAAAHGVADK